MKVSPRYLPSLSFSGSPTPRNLTIMNIFEMCSALMVKNYVTLSLSFDGEKPEILADDLTIPSCNLLGGEPTQPVKFGKRT
jgi:hypothetical protein